LIKSMTVGNWREKKTAVLALLASENN
jgi:hypothetical protein